MKLRSPFRLPTSQSTLHPDPGKNPPLKTEFSKLGVQVEGVGPGSKQKTARIAPGRLCQLVFSAGSATTGSVQPAQAAAAELSEDVVQQFAGFRAAAGNSHQTLTELLGTPACPLADHRGFRLLRHSS